MKLYLTSIAASVINKIDFGNSKKVAFIPTAADPYEDKSFVDADRDALLKKGFEVIDIDIKNANEIELQKKLSQFDIIFVAGGNTFYLLEKMQKCGFDKILPGLLTKGIIYIGSSAGSVVVGPSIDYVQTVDDPKKADLSNFEGLGIVNFRILPHYGNEKYLEKFNEIIQKYKEYSIITLTDDELIIVEDNTHRKI